MRNILTFDSMYERYKAEIEKIADKREIFEIAHKQDAEMREIISGVVGPVCDDLFGDMNVYAMSVTIIRDDTNSKFFDILFKLMGRDLVQVPGMMSERIPKNDEQSGLRKAIDQLEKAINKTKGIQEE